MRSETFGRLLKVGIGSIATGEGKTQPAIEDELGQQIGVTGASIQRYKAGHLPPELRTIEILAEAAIRRGYLNREWLQNFLHAAHYPAPEKLLDRLCPIGPARQRQARIYENLPAPIYSQFIMRAAAFAEVTEGLTKRSAAVLIVGFGGNGKTSLAREVAAQCLTSMEDVPPFDAAVWVSDKDRPGTTNLSVVLDEIARTLDYPGFTQFAHDEKCREVEQLLRRQRVLVIVDNFETITDSALLSWLLNLPEPSKALITTREYRREFRRGGWPVDLRGMSEAEARELIAERVRVLKIEKLVGDLAQFEPLLSATGGNPKAIEITIGLLKYERRPLQQVVDDLYAARGELFDDLFMRAWTLLDEAARRVLLVMTFFPTSASREAVSATADVQGFAFDRVVERLTDLALLDIQQADVSSTPRYTLHPLVRAFATAKLLEQPETAIGSRQRWIAWAVNTANQHRKEGWRLAEQFDRAAKDMSNFETVMRYCHENSYWRDLISIILSVKSYWTTRGFFQKRDDFLVLAINSAHELGDNVSLITLLALRTRTLCYLGDVETAESCLHQARTLLSAMSMPDPALIENLNEAQMRICFRTGDVEQQLTLARANVASASERDSPAEILYRYYIADYNFLAGNFLEAETQFLALIEESDEQQFQRGVMYAWLMLGKLALQRKDLACAEKRFLTAQSLADAMKHRRLKAEIFTAWANLHIFRGDLPAARASLAEAIDLFERLGMRRELAAAREELAQLEATIATA